MATVEDALHCPKCGVTGIKVQEKSTDTGGKVYVIHCQNKLCPWLNTGWIMQLDRHGAVVERDRGVKDFPSLNVYDIAAAKRAIDEVKDF